MRNRLKTINKKEKITIRILIIIGILSLLNFFYWFLDTSLIEDQLLYWMLMSLIVFDTFRILYVWYNYWDISIPIPPISDRKFTVDVLTTYFPGEPKNMLKETLIAIKKIRYPHTTYLCDEANDPDLVQFCKNYDIVHVTRNNRIDAKAGNINNALKQATGEICLILDPDHIPHEDFLEVVLPYFEDSKIGYIQTVQSYYNLGESPVAKGAAEQTFQFYGPVMMCMNSYGTVNAIGANCVFRRLALDSIGGHAAGLSEDMHTAMQLHAKGWTSLYVPQVLSAGLAPATLTSYFKQQLKWSRGTLELLVTTYPKLFRKFTFRQKLHYGFLPLHYLTGLIYMISFLIPVISLLTSSTPWKGNVLNFGLITFPIIASLFGIRLYVQKWVINKSERGMHLIGGLLLQVTWSIYLLGLVYTIIRKKVPYLPTVKDDDRKSSFYIILPNIIVFLISILAVMYGLYRDFTPFTVFMAGFALWNAVTMVYTLHFAYKTNKSVNLNILYLLQGYKSDSFTSNGFFSVWQKSAIPTLSLILLICGYLNIQKNVIPIDVNHSDIAIQKSIKYVGVFSPLIDNGISDMSKVHEFSKQVNQKMDIISFYIPWDKSIKFSFPLDEMHQVFQNNALPMITWEPWLNTFDLEGKGNDHVFELIVKGQFDDYIKQFAIQLKHLGKPIFLRFGHEFDNPFYPWYDDRTTAANTFKKAWIHTWNLFDQVGAKNVVWIYNPWKAKNAIDFFPGELYVDWCSANILNYATIQEPNTYYEFKALYDEFHIEFRKLGNFPVMISEFGSYTDGDDQKAWLEDAVEVMEHDYKEINAVVYFNSSVDNNMPNGVEGTHYLDWTIANTQNINLNFKTGPVPSYIFVGTTILNTATNRTRNRIKLESMGDIKGVNLKNSKDWSQDYHVLTRKNLEKDFTQMKTLGINTIKYTSNHTYNYNVTILTKEFNLKLAMGFWIPGHIDFIKDSRAMKDLKNQIIKDIKKYKNDTNIVSWNIQNDLHSGFQSQLKEPIRSYQIDALIKWLQELTAEIKILDGARPIILDVNLKGNGVLLAKKFMNSVEGIDAIGVIVTDTIKEMTLINMLQDWNIPFVYSDVPVSLLNSINPLTNKKGFFVSTWQDQYRVNSVTFDGLIDRKGRFKLKSFEFDKWLRNFDNTYTKKPFYSTTKPITILKTLTLLNSDVPSNYFAMSFDDKTGWHQIEWDKDIAFEWTLIKCDSYGNYITIEEVGNEPTLLLDIPKNYNLYRLQLSVIRGNSVSTTITTLNMPYIY